MKEVWVNLLFNHSLHIHLIITLTIMATTTSEALPALLLLSPSWKSAQGHCSNSTKEAILDDAGLVNMQLACSAFPKSMNKYNGVCKGGNGLWMMEKTKNECKGWIYAQIFWIQNLGSWEKEPEDGKKINRK